MREDDWPGGGFSRNLGQQLMRCDPPHLTRWLYNRREGGMELGTDSDAIKSNNRNVIGDADTNSPTGPDNGHCQ
jgi:hypothetical protein